MSTKKKPDRHFTCQLDQLVLDPNNFRIIHDTAYTHVAKDRIEDKNVAQRTYKLITGNKNDGIHDLIESFKESGYLPVDQIQVRTIADSDKYLVIEGNRRVAALKYLEREHTENHIDLQQLDPQIFKSLPVVRYDDDDPAHQLILMGLKHVSGNRKWGDWNQAQLIARLYQELKMPEVIARRIGISLQELKRTLRALSLVDQYKSSDYADQFQESKFPLFREAVYRSQVKKWLGWNEDTWQADHSENREVFFSLISEESVEDNDTTYGDHRKAPAITTRDEVRLLGDLINDPGAMAILESERNLNIAYRASGLVLEERQKKALQSLRDALGQLKGFRLSDDQVLKLQQEQGNLHGLIAQHQSKTLKGVENQDLFQLDINTHFSELRLVNYRGFQELHLTGLNSLNVITGINNAGKTSLLEAIYLLVCQNDFNGLLEIIRRRGKISEDRLDPHWWLEQVPEATHLTGQFSDKTSVVKFRSFKEHNHGIDRSRYLQTVEIDATFNGFEQESQTRLFKGRHRETLAEDMKQLCPIIFSSPFFLNEQHRYAAFYHQSVRHKTLRSIINFLRDHLMPSLQDIRLVDERQTFEVEDNDFPTTQDLSNYGEGLQRLFFIALQFAAVRNGVLLIDEFENAIHVELLEKFIPFLAVLAHESNVQVFITSHSKECLDIFAARECQDTAFFGLVRDGVDVTVRSFDGNTYKRLVASGDVDLRKAQ